MSVSIQIQLSEKIFIRNPQETELGKNIITHSIILIDKLGFEKFTFKKLAEEINSTEASVYRYFENKHKLLVYLVSWYWAWIEYMVDYKTNNISDPEIKLKIILAIIAASTQEDSNISHINESLLHKIVISEASKAYLTKDVDKENKEGFFINYKSLCKKIARVILQINPGYKYPNTLASSLIEMAHNQIFFARHLPSLTDVVIDNDNYQPIIDLLEHFAFNSIKSNK
jgi:AcrR family transcriptional regulator